MSQKEEKRSRVLNKVLEGKLSQIEGAKELGLSVRHFRRLQKEYIKNGIQALISKKRGKKGNNKSCPLENSKIIARIKERYLDFGPTLAHEKLFKEDGFKASRSHVRNLMIQEGIWQAKKQRETKVYCRRERRSRYGELLQVDGSHHDWFEGRSAKCCLIVMIDDATSYIGELYFCPSESTFSYFQAVENYIQKYGCPVALYADKHGVFRVNHGSSLESRTIEFGRAMSELDIRIICTNSPKARGRVERANKTLQDRLVKEMRLHNISSMEDANKFAEGFRKKHNEQFSVSPADSNNAPTKLDPSRDLDRLFSVHERRVVAKDLSFQFESTHFQIDMKGFRSRQIIGEKVLIAKNHKNRIRVFYKERELEFKKTSITRKRLSSYDEKSLNAEGGFDSKLEN